MVPKNTKPLILYHSTSNLDNSYHDPFKFKLTYQITHVSMGHGLWVESKSAELLTNKINHNDI